LQAATAMPNVHKVGSCLGQGAEGLLLQPYVQFSQGRSIIMGILPHPPKAC